MLAGVISIIGFAFGMTFLFEAIGGIESQTALCPIGVMLRVLRPIMIFLELCHMEEPLFWVHDVLQHESQSTRP